MGIPVKLESIKRPQVLASWAFDIALVFVLLSIRWDAVVRGDPELEATLNLPSWWWSWGNLQDWLLIGPDAGNWAANAEAWREGTSLDSHRLPVYSMLTAWFSGFFGDIVFAGHQVNHLLSALLGLLAYTIGRLTSGRAVAVGAGVLTAWSPELVNNQLLFGVDPALQFSALVLALSTLLALQKGTWPWVVGAGVCLAWAMATHYLLMLFVPVSAACFLLMRQPFLLRIRYMLAFLLIGWLGFQFFARDYDDLSVGMVLNVFTEGVAGSDGRVIAEGPMGSETATGIVMQNLPTAPRLAVQRGLRSMKVEGVPWVLLLTLFWVGLIGWGLRPRERFQIDWRISLFFLAFLSPLIGLEASRAPDRYALFSRPLFFLVVARGIVSVAYMAEFGLRRQTLSLFAANLVERFDEALRWLWRNPQKALIAFLGTLFVWGTTLCAVALVMSSFPDLEVSWQVVLATWTFTLTGMTFIPTAGFFGAYEACCAGALMLQGAAEGPAMAFAIVLHLGQFAYLAVVGVACLVAEGLSLRSAVAGSLSEPNQAV